MASLVFVLAVLGYLITNIGGLKVPIAGNDPMSTTCTVQPDAADASPVNIAGRTQDVWNPPNHTLLNNPVPHASSSGQPPATPTADNPPGVPTPSGTVICWRFPDTNIFYTELGVGKLLQQDGKPTIDAGPSKCARVACNYSGAIYWCNDNNHNITLENYDRLAWAATDIYEACNTNLTYEGLTSGQNFYYDEGWNVIVREDTC